MCLHHNLQPLLFKTHPDGDVCSRSKGNHSPTRSREKKVLERSTVSLLAVTRAFALSIINPVTYRKGLRDVDLLGSLHNLKISRGTCEVNSKQRKDLCGSVVGNRVPRGKRLGACCTFGVGVRTNKGNSTPAHCSRSVQPASLAKYVLSGSSAKTKGLRLLW